MENLRITQEEQLYNKHTVCTACSQYIGREYNTGKLVVCKKFPNINPNQPFSNLLYACSMIQGYKIAS